jgi:hypothetical protein
MTLEEDEARNAQVQLSLGCAQESEMLRGKQGKEKNAGFPSRLGREEAKKSSHVWSARKCRHHREKVKNERTQKGACGEKCL